MALRILTAPLVVLLIGLVAHTARAATVQAGEIDPELTKDLQVTPALPLQASPESAAFLKILESKPKKSGKKKKKPFVKKFKSKRNKIHRVCVRNVPNIKGILPPTCCNGLKCSFKGGVCCDTGSHCCPSGTVCVQGDPGTPPGCLHVMDEIMKQLGGKPQSPAAKGQAKANPHRGSGSSASLPHKGPAVRTTPIQRTPSVTQRQQLAQQGLPLVIPNPYGLKCQKMPCPGPVTQIVYEDALAPHSRNAFSQYRVQKTSEHHNNVDGSVEVQRMPLQGDKHKWAMPPLPPTLPQMRMGNNAKTAGNAKAKLSDPAVPTPLSTNVKGDASVIDKPKVVYNLPDKKSPTGYKPYQVTMKHVPKGSPSVYLKQARRDFVPANMKVDPRVGFLEASAQQHKTVKLQYEDAHAPSPIHE